ncbi:E3 ubiquitin-protein transferase MAEA-like [Halichondria panicea]|uniref:E3 ubiquitin-protein transferase MAEA-like n=1 Tax=Halichondria panicea TaxID=6063 RepID=UPI00312BC2A1
MATSTKDEIKTLEYSTLKVPYELLNKKFRSVQKILDREITVTTSDCSTLLSQPTVTGQEVDALLLGVSGKLVSLKRKAEEAVKEEVECVQACKTRLEHLKAYASGDQSDVAKSVWAKSREDRILVDHLLRQGHYSAALRLAQSSGTEHLVDTEIFLVCQSVEEGLKRRDTGPCLDYCHEHRSKLRRIKSQLEFQVRLQDFIELVRSEKRVEAIKYARKHFGSAGNEQFLREIQMAMGLLAFSPATKCKRYQKLFSMSRWSELIVLFRQENFNLFQLSPHSILTSVLQAGLSALKTPQCYKTEEFNSQCPVCSKSFNELAKSLPFAHCSQSYLTCNLSGQPMNEHNPPLMLPNGYVYGEKALKDMGLQNDGEVTCPRTKKTFKFSDAKKVYVM